MKLRSAILSQEERAHIHEESIRILQEAGVCVPSEKVLDMLEAHGAIVDRATSLARIPEQLVKKALETIPPQLTLAGRNPSMDYPVPSDRMGFTLDGTGTRVLDYQTGLRRDSVNQDNIDALLVFEHVEEGTAVWIPVVPGDVPSWGQNTANWITSLKYSTKHIQLEIVDRRQVPYLLDILESVLGDRQKIRERHLVSVVYCPVSPLSHDGPMLEANLELAKQHIPILVYPMAVNGSTGPASLYSCTSMTNAEILSGLVIFQLYAPGCPLMMGASNAPMDFHSGLCATGAPEMALQTGAIGDMAKYYGIPSSVAGCSSDNKGPGAQTVMEKFAGLVPLFLSRPDLVNGIGMFEGAMTLYLPQILVDQELIGCCNRMVDGIDVASEKDFLEDVLDVGPGGHFLKCKNTRMASRSKEFFSPKYSDRNPYDVWIRLGNPNIYGNAAKQVSDILRKGNQNPLPASVVEALDKIMNRALIELKEEEESNGV